MPDKLIAGIAASIKNGQDSAARAKKVEVHQDEFIDANCEAWFDSFCAEFERLAKALNVALAGSDSGIPELQFQRSSAVTVAVTKEDFPYAYGHASFSPQGRSMVTTIKAGARHGGQIHEQSHQWQFKVDASGNLVLMAKLSPQRNTTLKDPKELAKTLFKAMFPA
jgi:hypothetical protein